MAGIDQIIVPSGETLYAVDPKSGSLLWSYPIAELGLIDRMPLILPDDRLFLPLFNSGGLMLSIGLRRGPKSDQSDLANSSASRLQVEKLWQTTRLNQNSHAPPIYYDGHLYGLSGSILVCISAEDGTVRWRNRIYDGTLILVEGHLVIMSAGSGRLHVVKASPDRFEEAFSMPLLEVGQHTVTPPSYADRTIYVRNVQELVALELRPSEDKTESPEPVVMAMDRPTEGNGLREIWRRPLSTGIESAGEAGLTVDGGLVFTLIANGATEQALAVDGRSGAQVWRTPLDASRPEVSSAPGSTPAVANGRLFVLSSACRLRALSSATGEVFWQRDLIEDYGPIALERGCQTSPITVDQLLVVQTGSEASSRVIALRQDDGAEIWSSKGLAPTTYTSPVSVVLGGVPQILVHGQVSREEQPLSLLYSVRQTDGEPLWSFEAENFFSWLRPVVVENQVLLPTWRQTYLLNPPPDLGIAADLPRATEVWHQRTLDSAVYVKGCLYAYLDDEIVAIDAANGEIRWREDTFFGSISVAGDHLAVISYKTGVLRLVDASPDAYHERARLEVFNPGAVNYVLPTFADGTIFVRNREEMVAVASRDP